MGLDFSDYYEEFQFQTYVIQNGTKMGVARKECIESLDRVELLRLIWWCDKFYERYPELKQYKDEGCKELI